MDKLYYFRQSFCPYGAMDIERACELLAKLEYYDASDLADWCWEYSQDLWINIKDIDVVSLVYDKIMSEVNTLLFVDRDDSIYEYISMFPNYLDSSIYIQNWMEEKFNTILDEYLKKNPDDDTTVPVLALFISEINKS